MAVRLSIVALCAAFASSSACSTCSTSGCVASPAGLQGGIGMQPTRTSSCAPVQVVRNQHACKGPRRGSSLRCGLKAHSHRAVGLPCLHAHPQRSCTRSAAAPDVAPQPRSMDRPANPKFCMVSQVRESSPVHAVSRSMIIECVVAGMTAKQPAVTYVKSNDSNDLGPASVHALLGQLQLPNTHVGHSASVMGITTEAPSVGKVAVEETNSHVTSRGIRRRRPSQNAMPYRCWQAARPTKCP
mmetsp:Transcript_101591/g.287854  ORF Transcript_101591/g.287854 Transcript_101591/m.287854 type:complete len:242 (-) Transcript_101591:27-752(-)